MKSTAKLEQPDVVTESPVGDPKPDSDVLKFRERMLKWANPVEYVNNMYGCHPGDDDDDGEYFKVVFRK